MCEFIVKVAAIYLTAIVLCLTTGYLYGSLFFTPIDVPFLAAMTWATLAIVVMTRQVLPSWRATIVTGLLTGLALGTRTGGFITHAYLLGAMILCGAEFFARRGRLTLQYLLQMGARYGVVVVVAWITAIALWPWLQIGNPLAQFKIALVHFATIPMSFDLPHWGKLIMTDDLPRTYVPGQLLARLPDAFLVLLAVAFAYGIAATAFFLRETAAQWGANRRARWHAGALMLMLALERGILVVCAAVVLPLAFLVITHATIYDGIRHVLFVIPMLAVVASFGFLRLAPLLRRFPMTTATVAGAYVGHAVLAFVLLHPLQYAAFNVFAGGVIGTYGRFEQDYWSLAVLPALRRLEDQLDRDDPGRFATNPPSIKLCIGFHEEMVAPMFGRPWRLEDEASKADFIIESERWRCAKHLPVILVDELKRFGLPFARVLARQPADIAAATSALP